MMTEKKEWTVPKLTVHGDIEDITLGFSTGDHLDASFPINTQKTVLTFS